MKWNSVPGLSVTWPERLGLLGRRTSRLGGVGPFRLKAPAIVDLGNRSFRMRRYVVALSGISGEQSMLRPFRYGCARAGTFMAGTMLAAALLTPLRLRAADPPVKPTTPTAARAPSGTSSGTASSAGTSGTGTTSPAGTPRTPTAPGVSADREVIAYINKYIRQG